MKKNILVTAVTVLSVLFAGVSAPTGTAEEKESLLFRHIQSQAMEQPRIEEFSGDNLLPANVLAQPAESAATIAFRTCSSERGNMVTIAR